MSVQDIIKQRHSIGKMTNQVPSRTDIEQILEAATHAPNHHKTEPWSFFVLAGKARTELGTIMAESLAAKMAETTSEKAQAVLNKERNKPLRSPVLIVVTSQYPQQPNVVDIENIEAT